MKISFLFDQAFWAISIHRFNRLIYIYGMEYFHPLTRLSYVIQILSRWALNIELHPSAKLGKDIKIPHGIGIVIGAHASIGDQSTILQNVTIGAKEIKEKYSEKDVPTIGNNVILGAGCQVLGGVTIGNNSKIGANSVVLIDVPPNETAVGVPARLVSKATRKAQYV